jgi:hypothetical protein
VVLALLIALWVTLSVREILKRHMAVMLASQEVNLSLLAYYVESSFSVDSGTLTVPSMACSQIYLYAKPRRWAVQR